MMNSEPFLPHLCSSPYCSFPNSAGGIAFALSLRVFGLPQLEGLLFFSSCCTCKPHHDGQTRQSLQQPCAYLLGKPVTGPLKVMWCTCYQLDACCSADAGVTGQRSLVIPGSKKRKQLRSRHCPHIFAVLQCST
jgi:hypothetical protein